MPKNKNPLKELAKYKMMLAFHLNETRSHTLRKEIEKKIKLLKEKTGTI